MVSDNHDLSADELALSPKSLGPRPTRTRNRNKMSPPTTKKIAEPKANTSKKRSSDSALKQPPSKKTAASTAKPALKLRPPKRVKEDVYNEPERLLGPRKSLIYREETDVFRILLVPEIAPLYGSTSDGHSLAEASNQALEHFSEKFKEDGRNGYHDEQWIMDALQASRDRANGVFDEMLEERFRDWAGSSSEAYSDSENEADSEKEPEQKGGNLKGLKRKKDPDVEIESEERNTPEAQKTSTDEKKLRTENSQDHERLLQATKDLESKESKANDTVETREIEEEDQDLQGGNVGEKTKSQPQVKKDSNESSDKVDDFTQEVKEQPADL